MHKKHVKGLYSFALSHNVIEKYFDLKRTSMKIHSIPQQISDEGDFILWQNVVLARQAFELQQKTVKLSIWKYKFSFLHLILETMSKFKYITFQKRKLFLQDFSSHIVNCIATYPCIIVMGAKKRRTRWVTGIKTQISEVSKVLPIIF